MEKVTKLKEVALKVLKSGYPVLFIGDRGIGKTSVAWELAKELNKEIFYLNVSQLFPENISFPVVSNNQLEFTTFDLEGKIVLLDELTNRNPDMHSLLQSLVLDKRIGTRQFKDVLFIGTGNKPEQSSIATLLPRPLVERFVIMDFVIPSKEEWASYTLQKGGSQIFVSFILQATENLYYKPNVEEVGLEQYPSPRNNTRTAIILKDILPNHYTEEDINNLDYIIKPIVEGSSGKEVYLAFYNYLKSGRYYSYKNFERNDYPRSDIELFSLIVDVAELQRKGELGYKEFSEVFDYVFEKYPRYKHYFVSYTGLHCGKNWKEGLYQFIRNNANTKLYQYYMEVRKSLERR